MSIASTPEQCSTLINLVICDTVSIGHGLFLRYPTILPFCVISLIVGFATGIKTLRSKKRQRRFYALAFFMTGVMMVVAGAVDSFIMVNYLRTLWTLYFLATNIALTWGIAICFGICGLLDYGILKSSKCLGFLFAVIVAGMWYCVYHLIFTNPGIFRVIYSAVVGLGCGTWIVC